MKKSLLILPVFLFAFNVEFTKIYKKYVTPNKDAVLIQTKISNLTFPFKYYKVNNGYILTGNMQDINNYLNNDFYAPNDAKFKNIKIALINTDTIQYKIIQKLKNKYPKCKIKDIIFLSPDEKRIITHPIILTLKYKIKMDCQ